MKTAPRPRIDIGKLFDRQPPASDSGELCLLGSMLLYPPIIPDVVERVGDGSAFYHAPRGALYDLIVKLYNASGEVDSAVLSQAIADSPIAQAFPDGSLVNIASSVPTHVNWPHYAALVADRHRLRRLVELCGESMHDAMTMDPLSTSEDVSALMDRMEQSMFALTEQAGASATTWTIQELLQKTYDAMEAGGSGEAAIPTGLRDLDEQLGGGLRPAELVIVAGRPSMGKTAFALTLMERMAKRGTHVGMFSLEMSRQAVIDRLVSSASGVNSQEMRSGRMTPDQMRACRDAVSELGAMPLFVDETSSLSIDRLRSLARRMHRKHKVQAVIVDYLQLMTAEGKSESRQVEVSTISRGLKAMARELHVPVVALSQLNRGAENRADNRPRMSDLRESGSIEQDADAVLLLHREFYYRQYEPGWKDNNPDAENEAEVIIAKQRNGPTGAVKVGWSSSLTKFGDYV